VSASLARFGAPCVVDPARVLLAVGVSQLLEIGARLGVRGESVCKRLGQFNLSRRGVEIEGDRKGVPGLDAGCVADRAIQTEQELAAHARDGRAPRVSVYRRDD